MITILLFIPAHLSYVITRIMIVIPGQQMAQEKAGITVRLHVDREYVQMQDNGLVQAELRLTHVFLIIRPELIIIVMALMRTVMEQQMKTMSRLIQHAVRVFAHQRVRISVKVDRL